MSNERVKTIKERKVEEKITVRMTDTYLFDFTLYHTYSKLAGFLTNILVAAIAFMGIIMLVMGKIKPVQIIFYLVAAVVFIVYTPLLLKYRSKKQVKRIERYHVPNEMTFNDEGIQVEFADKKETYEWEQIQKVVKRAGPLGAALLHGSIRLYHRLPGIRSGGSREHRRMGVVHGHASSTDGYAVPAERRHVPHPAARQCG